jgi:hypothetical protein
VEPLSVDLLRESDKSIVDRAISGSNIVAPEFNGGSPMVWIKWGSMVLAALVAAVVFLATQGASRWDAETLALLERLEAARTAPAPARYDATRELEGLPAPVRRYFRTVLTHGQPIVAAVTVEHRGTFNLGEASEQWKPFTSRQRVVTQRPGFVWDGKVALFPGLNVRVHDAYVAGEGILHPSILGLFTLADLRGTGDLAKGELMRFFAEAAWYPTALLPSQGVRWEALDERSAIATLADGDQSVAMRFAFAADGTMESVHAEARGRAVAGKMVMTPWEGRWSGVQERDGMRVPMTGEVAWLTPEGRRPYWRGTVSALRYEFAR